MTPNVTCFLFALLADVETAVTCGGIE